MNGYQGKVLRVDLSNRRSFEEDLDPDLVKKYEGADHESSIHEEAYQRKNALPDLGFTHPMSRKTI